jgi:hypothetical protein
VLTKSKVVSLVGPILILIGLVLPIANTPVHQNSAIYLLNPAYLGLLMLLLALSGVVVALRFSLNLMIAIGLAAFAGLLVNDKKSWIKMGISRRWT